MVPPEQRGVENAGSQRRFATHCGRETSGETGGETRRKTDRETGGVATAQGRERVATARGCHNARWWEERFYTPPPPGSGFSDCDCARIETKASIHPPLWVVVVVLLLLVLVVVLVVVYRIGFQRCGLRQRGCETANVAIVSRIIRFRYILRNF